MPFLRKNQIFFALNSIFIVLFIMSLSCSSGNSPDGSDNDPAFTISVNINSPQNNGSFIQNEAVIYSGTAVDELNRSAAPQNMIWRSDKDGLIGFGNRFQRSGLSVNTHRITLTATSENNAVDSASIILENSATADDVAVLLSDPPAGSTVRRTDLLQLSANATGPGGTPINNPLQFEWHSNINGIIGNGSSISAIDLTPSVGHLLTVVVYADDAGTLSGQATVEVAVNQEMPSGISADILAPASGSQFTEGSEISFVGSASDANGDPIVGTSVEWRSGNDGFISFGQSCVIDNLTRGIHRITMIATENGGDREMVSISVEIL